MGDVEYSRMEVEAFININSKGKRVKTVVFQIGGNFTKVCPVRRTLVSIVFIAVVMRYNGYIQQVFGGCFK